MSWVTGLATLSCTGNSNIPKPGFVTLSYNKDLGVSVAAELIGPGQRLTMKLAFLFPYLIFVRFKEAKQQVVLGDHHQGQQTTCLYQVLKTLLYFDCLSHPQMYHAFLVTESQPWERGKVLQTALEESRSREGASERSILWGGARKSRAKWALKECPCPGDPMACGNYSPLRSLLLAPCPLLLWTLFFSFHPEIEPLGSWPMRGY